MKIDVYSHNFCVTDMSRDERIAIQNYVSRNLTSKKMSYENGRKHWVPDKEFFSHNEYNEYARFHINLANEFIKAMLFYQIPKENIKVTRYTPVADERFEIELELIKLWTPKEHQVKCIDHIQAPGYNKVINLQAGGGKAAPLSSAVRIPGGWSTMGEMHVGKTIIGQDGKPQIVTGVFPQGVTDVYRVTFKDGRSTIVDGRHLWKIHYNNTSPGCRWKVVDTLTLKEMMGYVRNEIYVPLINAEDGPETPRIIDSYVLGIFLGDAHLGDMVRLTTPDQFIVDEVSRLLPEGCVLNKVNSDKDIDYLVSRRKDHKGGNAVTQAMRSLCLNGCRSWEKFIPTPYLEGSRNQRLSLLQGLLDTDGTASKSGSVKFYTSSPQLAEDVQYLARSLGAYAKIHTKVPHYTYKGERLQGRLSYKVSIRYKQPSELFRLPKKKERTNDKNQYAEGLKLRVASVEHVGREETQCISVSNEDHLYVTDDFIVTHNTEIAKHCMLATQLRTAGVMKSSYIDRWIPDMEDSFVYKKGELLEIAGGAAMNSIMESAIDGEYPAKTLFFSTKTISLYLDSFEKYGVTDQYPIAPIDFFHKLGIGLGILDEAHQFTHAIMKFFTYLHIHKFVNLSGTLDTQDPFKTRIREVMFPAAQRFTADYYNVYIVVTAALYQLKRASTIRCTGYGGAYNHTKFEETLMLGKNREMLKAYMEIIAHYVDMKYVSVRSPGQKYLVFCATIKMCQMVVKYLSKLWPHLNIGIYVSTEKKKVKDDVLANADIIVSTVLSCGTAVDVPNLRGSLLTINLDSQESNEQAMLRTRPLRDWPDVDAEFTYLICTALEKHLMYHENKKQFFRNKIKAHCIDHCPISL